MADALVKILEWSWAGGFFDGEGSTYVNRGGGATKGGTLRVSIGHVELEPLCRFLAAVGRGSVTGPYYTNPQKNPRHRPHYSYQAYGRNAQDVLDVLWPSLSGPKREQACRALEKLNNDDAARTGRMSSGAASNN